MIIELCNEVTKCHQRKERKRKQTYLFAPTIEEMIAHGNTIGLSEEQSRACWHHHNQRGWKYKSGLPMCDYKSAMWTWKSNQIKFAGIATDTRPERVISVSDQQKLRRRNGQDCVGGENGKASVQLFQR